MSPGRLRGLCVALALLCSAAGGCREQRAAAAQHPDGYETLELRYQGSTGNVLYPELAADLGYLRPLELRYVGNTISGPQDLQSAVSGDVDFALAFNGVIAKMVAAKAPLRSVVGVYNVDPETWNAFYVLADSPVRGARDFIGRKVAMNTLGAHSEYVLKEYLTRNGLSAQEIAQVMMVVVPPVNAEQALRQRQVDVAHFLWLARDKALERGGIRSVVSDYDLFGRFNAASYVLSESFIAQKPKAARKFVEAVAKAVEWGRATPREQVIERLRRILRARKRNENDDMLKHWRPAAARTQGGVLTDRDFGIWIDWLVKEGQLKPNQIAPSDVFTNQFNPYAPSR